MTEEAQPTVDYTDGYYEIKNTLNKEAYYLHVLEEVDSEHIKTNLVNTNESAQYFGIAIGIVIQKPLNMISIEKNAYDKKKSDVLLLLSKEE
jgi:hypothetical protein